MKISIVTTCFNSEKTIRDTIESVLNQQFDGELEYIITEAGSKDGTLSIIKEYGNKLKLVDAKGTNQSEGINMGLQMATGDIIAFINADDTYIEGTFQKVINAFNSNPEKNWLTGQCKIINENNEEILSSMTTYKNFFLSIYSYFLLLGENFISQPATFWRKGVHEKFGYFDTKENLVMDYEFWLRIGYKNSPIIIKEYLSSFRRMTNTKSNSRFKEQFKDDKRVAIKYIKEHRMYLAAVLKYLNYFKTILIYSLIIK